MIHLSRSKNACGKEGNPDHYYGFYIIGLSHFEELRQMIFYSTSEDKNYL